MAKDTSPKITPGEIGGWPRLLVSYRTDAAAIADLLPPGFTPGAEPNVYLSFYQVPVPDEPEHGVRIWVDADYEGTKGQYTIGIGIDQEAAVFISRDMNGQPKFPCDVTYYRFGDQITARATHQGYTFVEFKGEVQEVLPSRDDVVEENEWWVKYSPAVGGVEKSYDLPPMVVRVRSERVAGHTERVDGSLTLLASPWDPIQELLPFRELRFAQLENAMSGVRSREISVAGKLDPDAFWPHVFTISGSRWPGHFGGPRRR